MANKEYGVCPVDPAKGTQGGKDLKDVGVSYASGYGMEGVDKAKGVKGSESIVSACQSDKDSGKGKSMPK